MKCNRKNQRGFSLIELLIVVAIILVISAIAIPSLLQARAATNEASAVSSLRTINMAQTTYLSNFPTVGYAPTLNALGGTSCAPADETSACLIDTQLASGNKSGYNFNATGVGPVPAGEYFATGLPVSGSGNRSFCSTEDGVIHFDPSGAAISDHDSCQALASLQ